MSDFRKLAHLKEQLGDERFLALINSDNTGKIKKFCDKLLKDATTQITIGGRTYDLLIFVGHIGGCLSHVEKMQANLGKEDGEHFLKYQNDIPTWLQEIHFVFPDWRRSENISTCVYWSCGSWTAGSFHLNSSNELDDNDGRLLRRK